MKINSYDFIWNCYTPDELARVVDDAQLSNQGFKFLYVIDTYDIVENFLPYTEIELFSKGDSNKLAHKFICYDFLFGHFDDNPIILANEYQVELLAVKNKLQKQLNEVKAVYGNLKKLKEQTPDFTNEARTREFLVKHFEIILLLLIINDKRKNIFQEFLNFIRDRLTVSEIKVIKNDSATINKIFDDIKPSSLSVEIFERFVEDNKPFLVSIEDDNDRHIFLENTFRDIQVVERVMKINKEFTRLDLKYYVVYLSSANKTKDLLDAASKVVQGYKFQFHRNIFQYFLNARVKTEFGEDSKKTIDLLTGLNDARHKIERIKNEKTFNWGEYSDIGKSINKMFREASIRIDNHFFLSIYRKYNFHSEDSKEESTTPLSPENVRKILREIDQNEDNLVSKLTKFDQDLEKLNRSFEVTSLLPNLHRRVAKDIIQNAYQHIPLLLFFGDEVVSSELHEFVDELIELSKEASHSQKEKKNSVLKKLDRIVNKFESARTVNEKYTRSIIFAYISFVGNNVIESEDELIANFEGLLKMLEAQNLAVDIPKSIEGNRLSYVTKHNKLLPEICYVLIWLYRRNKRQDDGISLGEKYLGMFSNDPRLLHGVGLCHQVKDYERLERDDFSGDLFNASAFFFEKALQGYQLKFEKNKNEKTKSLLVKSQTAILNSLANSNIRKYASGLGGIELIFEADKLMTDIKTLFSKISLDFEKHVTYFGTSIEVLYYFARHNKQSGDLPIAKKKITEASLALSRLTQLSDFDFSSDFFKKRFKEIPKLMNEIVLKK